MGNDKLAICHPLDHPNVNPPKLAGGPDVCSKCKKPIYVSYRTRDQQKEHPDMVLICHPCFIELAEAEKAFRFKLIEPTKTQLGLASEVLSKGDPVLHLLAPNSPNCPKCGAPPIEHKVENYDVMWQDGDVVCKRCGTKVRDYDAS